MLLRVPFQQQEGRRLTERDAAAVGIEGAAGRLRHHLQRVEAVQRGAAKAVHTADHGRVAQPERQPARGRGDHLGAG